VDLAVRSTIFSAAVAVLTALCVALLVRRRLAPHPWSPAAGIAALAIDLAPEFWSQAVIAEVYRLNAPFIALLLRFMFQAIQPPAPAPPWAARWGTM
jgi:hypothetical protein